MAFPNLLIYKFAPSAPAEALLRQRQWVRFIQSIRKYFGEQGCEECLTPTMVISPGTEPSIDTFEMPTTKENMRVKCYLRTSPEISIKKLICMGMTDCFEIAQVFRDKEWTDQHRPEFTMLEWYRLYKNLQQIETDVRGLIEFLAPHKKVSFRMYTIAELFAREGLVITPETSLAQYREFCVQLQLDHQSMTSIDDYFFLIWTAVIEPKFDSQVVTFVKDYPPFQKAYSKIDPQTGWAQRMEFYWQGYELGNAFYEETDSQKQKLQFDEDNKKKREMGKSEVALDQEFIALMPQMPECAGIAVGLDRLFLCVQ